MALLREDIASLEKAFNEKLMPEMGEAALEKLKWSSVTIVLNKNLDNFSRIAKELTNHGIPVHETFGAGGKKPEVFKVAIGSGFDREQIVSLVDVLLSITDGWISFAHEEPDYVFDNRVVIGAYGSYSHGMELNKIKTILQRKDITVSEIYQVLGK